MSRNTTIIISALVVIFLVLAGLWYWLFFENTPPSTTIPGSPTSSNGFTPLNPSTPTTPVQQPNTPATSSESTTTPIVNTEKLPKIRKLYNGPIATGLYASSTATGSVVYFADRGNGHTYRHDIYESGPIKISNTTILRVYESYWSRGAKYIVMRYIREGSSTVTNMVSALASELRARVLSNSTQAVVFSPKGDKLFTLEQQGTGSIGYISNMDGSARIEVFDSPLVGWIVSWPEDNTITFTTKASYKSPGYLYFLDVNKKTVTKILGPVIGLTTNTSKDAKKVFFSQFVGGATENKILSVAENAIQSTYIITLPEKCIWSSIKKTSIYCAVPNEPIKNLPDTWYKGQTSSTDQIWHIDTVSNGVNKVANLIQETGMAIDAIDLTLDQKELSLYFINKKDLSLWSIDLND